MKKIYFAVVVLMTGFISNVNAQTAQSDNDNITGKAQVIAAINVTKGNDLQFGMVTQNVAKTISNTGTILQGNSGTGSNGAEQVGTFTIAKGINTLVTLAFTLPSNLADNATTPNQLPIAFSDYSGNKLARLTGATTAVPFTPTSSLAITNTGDLAQYYATGSFGVSIGGTVTPGASQVQGEYSGTITLTATYN